MFYKWYFCWRSFKSNLMFLLNEKKNQLNLNLVIQHFNHGIFFLIYSRAVI